MLRVIDLNRWLVFWGGLLLLGLCLPVQAHNGAMAIAVPVEGITIDGDLSDWPGGMEQYPIALLRAYARPKGTEDFQGWFRIGYSDKENALYLAVEMKDESVVIDTTAQANWNTQDGCEVYVAPVHPEEKVPIGQYNVRGNKPGVYGAEASLADFQVAVGRGVHEHRYEWRIDIVKKTQGQIRLHPGVVLGVTVSLVDKDEDGSFSMESWGPFVRFSTSGTGDVVLAGGKEETGRVEGQMRWEGNRRGVAHARVQVQSLDEEARRVRVKTDKSGFYTLDLPAGRYRVVPELRHDPKEEQVVEVKSGQMGEAGDIWVSTPGRETGAGQGKRVKAGPGKRTRSGERTWKGRWQSLGVGDGLSDPSVISLFQDREGYLWLGTLGGVSRYDGQEFVTFTKTDGLPGNTVSSILQDSRGSLWFGTGGAWLLNVGEGICRYEGKDFTVFTTADGLADNQVLCMLEDRKGHLWVGTAKGVSRYDGEQFLSFTAEDGLPDNTVKSILEDRQGYLWFGTDRGVSRYDGQILTTFTTEDGLGGNEVSAILEDRQGHLWFATWGGGVSRYDGQQWTHFTTQDGLINNQVHTILEDRQGYLWFGTDGGVSRYDGHRFTNFTAQDGLAHWQVLDILEDRNGDLWFGTGGLSVSGNGVSRYAGEELTTFTAQGGLVADQVMSLAEDRQGNLWFGTWRGVNRYDGRSFKAFKDIRANTWSIVQDKKGDLWFATFGDAVYRYGGETLSHFTVADGLADYQVVSVLQDRAGNMWFGTWQGGVSRYDGRQFTTFTTADGLASNEVGAVLEDRQGHLWVGTKAGVSRYDGQQWISFTTADGLASNEVESLLEDRQGHLWLGTWGGGVSRYDGREFKNFTAADGLAHNRVSDIMEDREGHLGFATWGGGVSLYDGLVFQTLLDRDGLASNATQEVLQDRHGNFWIATEGGITRYRPHPAPPLIRLSNVIVDRDYGPIEAVELSTSQDYLAFQFHGSSFKTRPGQLAYVYQLQGYDTDWRVTREERVVYTDLPRGDYVFAVKAVDRDLTYSETPATVRVTIHPPYDQIALVGGLGLALVGLVFTSGTAIRRHRAFLQEQRHRLQAQEALNRELEEELQTAHTLQMDLMPRESPQIPGLDLAGRCIPANHVGGDLFQYFQQDGRLSIALADVTGHAMEAAIPMVMFSGVLRSQMESGGPIEELFGRLNRSLHNAAGSRTFVCFAFGTIDTGTSTLRLSSAAFPYPYHFSAATGEIAELRVDAYPLGVRPDTTYQAIERQLAPGDYLVFCSDGIIEATDGTGAQFGYERTADVLRSGCAADLSAEALLERIVGEVREFRGETPQGDDQTVVVLRVEEETQPG